MNRNILIFGIVFVLLISLSFILLNHEKNSKIEKYLNDKTLQYQQSYNANYNGYKKLAYLIYDTDINIASTKEIFAQATTKGVNRALVREELYKKLRGTYQLLKKYNIKQLHFHLPNNESFLRFHRPAKFGDNLTDVRETVKYVNETHKAIDGFEEGRIYNGYRFVFPLSFEGRYIGSVEASYSTLAMSMDMINDYKIIAQFLISKEAIDEKVFSEEKSNYIQSPFEDYMFEMAQMKKILKHVNRNEPMALSQATQAIVHQRAFTQDSFSLYEPFRKEVMTFLKVQNPISKKVVGIMVLKTEAEYIFNKLQQFYISLFFSTIFIVLILLFIYKELKNKESLTRRVEFEVLESQKKDRLLFQQSKMASMGEMIGNIAHQWRQPIAIISMWANNIIADIDMNDVENENLRMYANRINNQTNHLSQTIDDFRNFFAPNKDKSSFTLKSSIDKTISLLSAAFKTHNIEVIQNIQEVKITALENELTQAILNIIKNSKDILVTLSEDKKRLLLINIYKEDDKAVINIRDNGGGIPKEILNKVFEPYFTTKHKSQGTGIGLYMTESIITKHLHGTVDVDNVSFLYKGKEYRGASFNIKIPLLSEDKK